MNDVKMNEDDKTTSEELKTTENLALKQSDEETPNALLEQYLSLRGEL